MFFDFLASLGGAQLSTITLYKELLRNNIKTDFVTPGSPTKIDNYNYPEFIELTNVPCNDFFNYRKLGLLFFLKNFLKSICSFSSNLWKGDKVIVYNFKSYFFVMFCKLVLLKRVSVVYYFRGWGKKEEYSKLRRFLLRFSNHYLAVSYETKTQLSEWLSKEKISVCYTSIDFGEFRIDEYSNAFSGKINLVFVGSIIPLKGLNGIINSIANSQYKKDIILHIIGGPTKELSSIEYYHDCIKMLKRNDIQYLEWGRVSPPYDFLPKSSILLSNSKSEGMPRGVCESILNHIPVFANPVGGIIDLIESCPLSIYSCLFEKDELDKCISKLSNFDLGNTSERNKLLKMVDVSYQYKTFLKEVEIV